jgi:uncharacterized protein (DUF433 family)
VPSVFALYTPVFRSTRVPILTLFDYLERDYTLGEFLECFPTLIREMACAVLEGSETAAMQAAVAAMRPGEFRTLPIA